MMDPIVVDLFLNDEIEDQYFHNNTDNTENEHDSVVLTDELKLKLFALHTLFETESFRTEHEKLTGFKNIIEGFSDLEFFHMFRLKLSAYEDLLQKVFPENNDPSPSHGRVPVDKKIKLLMSLWYLGHRCTFKTIALLFGVSPSAAHKHIDECTQKIAELHDEFIKWPTIGEQQHISNRFQELSGFPGVIGAIDGCHIDIKAPSTHQDDYIDRTNRHSINLMAVCKDDKSFTNIFVGFPGSAHDQRVHRISQLGKRLTEDATSLINNPKNHIIGDSAFALNSSMMVPYKNNGELDAQKLNFNTKISMTRRLVENAFGFVKGRFPRLKYIDADLTRIPTIVTAACVLHNICMAQDDITDIERLAISSVNSNPTGYLEPEIEDPTYNIGGNAKRDQISRDLWQL